ncbi:Do family serine endopeptidase [Aliirhizobium smilacinae]|uniref:Probable periplasmic serine endoprotease DegP-like n=1 Tax=Aliirhizobium smilacinae TaxID=1395944 RepID=A0A5C4XI15_9HYPH|nr:Do family serine endopeptidase [Rhizobium smilacinae]TNM62220.1 Do family serine endopeptidase [Rhizobium smilacinae]
MAQQVRSSWKRIAAGGIALAVAAAPMSSWAQTQPDAPAQAQAPSAPSQARPSAPGAMLPAPAPPSTSFNPPPSPKAGMTPAGPASIADLSEGLLDAVVNISTSQSVKNSGKGPQQPQIQEGSPFQEFFDDFFDGEGGQRGNQKVSSLGSGFVIDSTGYVVTNNHVIEGADDIEVVFANGSKLKATLIGTDTKTDLSVLKVEPKSPLKAVPFGDSRRMRIGDWVMAIGNPFGLGGSVTLGIISARGRNINAGPYDNFIQTDAAINKGNSGGPLFNMRGEVIGINTAIISPSGGSIGIGFAVPTEIAENVVRQLIEFGETRRGWLGVRIQPVTDEVSESLGLDRARGALVSGIINDGPIKNGEIKAGDVIVSFDGQSINEMRDLPRIVAESPVGKEVDVVILRDGKQQTVKVTPGRLEDSVQSPEADGDEPDDSDVPNPDNGGDQSAEQSKEPVQAYGMTIAVLDEDRRKSFDIAESVEGVVVTEVAAGSLAAEKGVKPGEVIVEVAQDFVEQPSDVTSRMDALKAEGRRNAHIMIADKAGNLRFVAIPLD